ncbi:hypothetical protein U1Q18_046855 [Sarracenia purpurea var. burkii]
MEFRSRNYTAEEEAYSLPRASADTHPLSTPSPPHNQVAVVDHEKIDFYDPLRGSDVNAMISISNLHDEESGPAVNMADVDLSTKEWTSFKKLLLQRFSGSKMVSSSMVRNPFLLILYLLKYFPLLHRCLARNARGYVSFQADLFVCLNKV